VVTPTRRSRSAVAGPTPGITLTDSGASSSSSVPGSTTTSPSGLRRSLAIFAISFDVPIPTDPVSPPVTSRTRSFSSSATAVTAAVPVAARSPAARSTNASSSESGSTSGDIFRSSAITCSLVRR
jgi:hypothetical protein